MFTRVLSRLVIAFFLICASGSHAEGFHKLNFLTEVYPPYNFTDKGQLQGIAVDLLLEASKAAGAPLSAKNIKVLPWARAYKMAEVGPNVALFSTTRTEQRENKFQWVGPISPTRIVLLAKKGAGVNIQSKADIKKYRVGVIRDDIGDQLVQEAGVTGSNIQRNSKAEGLVKMLNGGRIQLWAYEENVARWSIKQAGLNSSDFEVAYVLKESELYFTLSKDVPKKLVQKLQSAIDQVKQGPAFAKIKAKY